MIRHFVETTHGVRRLGSAAIDLCYVACGRFESYFEFNLKPWDVAAGSLLIQEAGGLVGNFSGEADFLETGECMAATPRVYAQMASLLGKYSQFATAGEKAAVRQSLSLKRAQK